ncbi:DUF2515 domain-containing protein [Paenibacillus rigui]|uniref:DUF2515 domain-containing protein n=1 Tax=Paenibacillus rigui TaxID=554312 RepID=A0A229UWA5_9BACL|nr:DUF2515 domain-containing protein [Paenibacillus rigui]OXM87179.1 hypothetical protein CF651_05890 [Paenibacillus rigui]
MTHGKTRWNAWDLLHKLTDVPQEIGQWVKGKAGTLWYESQQLDHMTGIRIRKEHFSLLDTRLRAALALTPPPLLGSGQGITDKPEYDTTLEMKAGYTAGERPLVQQIREETAQRNRNNVTRTQAYWELFQRLPELHWALLAHMVSRNGGWCMTDLKGELLPYLLNSRQQEHVFAFLERANALIFQDAYPQLLLYEASLRARRPLFHLLRPLHISVFMQPVWELFWERRDSALLTIALIVNEQNYIEERIVQHPVYRKTVLDTLFFYAQSLLQLNQVVFPYDDDHGQQRLAGLILEDFTQLHERIEFGKKLYALLFGIPAVQQGVLQFAGRTRHSGSRSDYWPHLFAAVRQGPPVPRGQLKEWLDGCSLRPGAAPLYSPRLEGAWKDRPVEAPEPGDWCRSADCLRWITTVEPPFSFEMTHEYCFGLNKIELAVLAGDFIE